MFITFDKYKELGGTIQSEIDFNRLEFQARCEVNDMTFDRLKNYDAEVDQSNMQYVEAINFCMLELIENGAIVLQAKKNAQQYGGNISSMSNDGYSVSFANDSGSASGGSQGISADRINIIRTYLPSNLLYVGTSI